MQIDFHHAVTYVAARFAGFGHEEADRIAYCAQYVDDATNSGTITFDNDAMYTRICSAHRMLDTRNLNDLANHQVWLPFHFLPGNGGLHADETPPGGFIEKILCCPDSPVAEDMLQACVLEKDELYGLHRLGITMHVYADTWAHQGFAGVAHGINRISALDDGQERTGSKWSRFKERSKDLWDRAMSTVTGDVLPLGHGSALTFPDMPYLTWSYRNAAGETITRNNTRDFAAAADGMCRAMQRYRGVNESGIPESEQAKIRGLFLAITDEQGEKRHEKWLYQLAGGAFAFGPVHLTYRGKGPGSWKHVALGTEKQIDLANEKFPYEPAFLGSDWKLFHDALQAHRFTVIYDILPRYGICAA